MSASDRLLSLFVDGVAVPMSSLPNADNPSLVDTLPLPANLTVIAVAAAAEAGEPAWLIAADLLGRVMTNSSWRCSEVEYSHWMMPTYDSSWWLPAAIKNVSATRQQLAPISSTAAVGIWTQNATAYTTYCRLDISESAKDIPSQNSHKHLSAALD